MMFEKYKKQVKLAFEKRQYEQKLSLNLIKPSAAKMREECLIVINERSDQKDDDTLRLFFGAKGEAKDYESIIAHIDIDKFRPLINFIKGKTYNPDEKNIELLAWLIDFEPRPYAFWRNCLNEKRTNKNTEAFRTRFKEEDDAEDEVYDKDWIKKKIRKFKIAGSMSLCSLTSVVVGGFYVHVNEVQQCMYWETDRYKPILCNERIEGVKIITMDPQKMVHFKKITVTDTLTNYSIGKVWYSKINDEVEFFTAKGRHPVHPEEVLKPATQYIIDTYK
ncbi:hypothetical protein [Pedobacter sp.]|uniref:hypothetical protein n=1 Tax=Pedobacter sp. TaxID=1411316 RepID=UPI00396C9D72